MQYNIAIATNLYISREKNWRNATSPLDINILSHVFKCFVTFQNIDIIK